METNENSTPPTPQDTSNENSTPPPPQDTSNENSTPRPPHDTSNENSSQQDTLQSIYTDIITILPTIGTIRLPGFIDTHVHIREANESYKENFDSSTCSALAGGITMICIMPNTCPPIADETTLNSFRSYAKKFSRCDYALYLAASEMNSRCNCLYAADAAGLIMHLQNIPCYPLQKYNMAAPLRLPDMISWITHLKNWPKRAPGPIVCRAEKYTIAAIILFAYIADRHIHLSHVSKKDEILLIRFAKEHGLNITCEVCIHHLFLTIDDIDRIGKKFATIKPELGTMEDQQALWDNINYIDIFSTDHLAYTKCEKNCIQPQLNGLPGLETILPLLLNACNDGRLTINDIIEKFHKNPKKIFNLPDQPNTYIEVKMNEEWIIPEKTLFSKARWTPYAGLQIKGKLHRVILRGEVAFHDDKILVPPGYGYDIRNKCYKYRRCMQ